MFLLNVIVLFVLALLVAFAKFTKFSYAIADWNLLLVLPSLTLTGFAVLELMQKSQPLVVLILGSFWLIIGFILQFEGSRKVWKNPNFASYSIKSRLELRGILSDCYKSIVNPMRWGWLPVGIVFVPLTCFASIAKTIAAPKNILFSQSALIFLFVWIGIVLFGLISKGAKTAPGSGMLLFWLPPIYLPIAIFLNLVFGAMSIFDFVSPELEQFLNWFLVSIGWPMGVHFAIALGLTIVVRFRIFSFSR